MGFAENMKAFATEVDECIRPRTTAVTDVNIDAARILGQAQEFVSQVTQEHKVRAEHVHSTLAEAHRDRQTRAQTLRGDISKHLTDMRQHLNEMLGQARASRQEQMGQLRSAFQEQHTALTNDLREAGQIWRGRARR